MIIYFGTVAFILLALSCKDEKDEAMDEQIAGIHVSSLVAIGVKNEAGTDLLDPNLPGSTGILKYIV